MLAVLATIYMSDPGGKMTVMDILEFIDINGPSPMTKYGTIWLNCQWVVMLYY